MPAYEFICLKCKKQFDKFFTYAEYGKKTVACPFCQSENIRRRIGRIRVAKSEESRLASLSDPTALDRIDEDPQSLGKMMRKMSSEIGEDMGAEFDEVIGRLERGQSPEQIEKELPDLGAGDTGGLSGSGGFDSDF